MKPSALARSCRRLSASGGPLTRRLRRRPDSPLLRASPVSCRRQSAAPPSALASRRHFGRRKARAAAWKARIPPMRTLTRRHVRRRSRLSPLRHRPSSPASSGGSSALRRSRARHREASATRRRSWRSRSRGPRRISRQCAASRRSPSIRSRPTRRRRAAPLPRPKRRRAPEAAGAAAADPKCRRCSPGCGSARTPPPQACKRWRRRASRTCSTARTSPVRTAPMRP